MCDCKKVSEERLLKHLKEQKPDGENHSVQYMGYAFGMSDDGFVQKPFMLAEFKHDYELKTRHGEFKLKKEKINIYFNFCPWCGEKIA